MGLRPSEQGWSQTCEVLEPPSCAGVSLPAPRPPRRHRPLRLPVTLAAAYLPGANHLLGSIDRLAAAGAALGAPHLLGKLGGVGVGGGLVARGPAQGDMQ